MRYSDILGVTTALCCFAISGSVIAQAPGGGFGGPPPGGGFQQPGGGFRGNGGGFRRPRMSFGTVSAVDVAAGTITLSTFNGGTQTVNVAPTANMVTQSAVTIADLKVGDHVAVQGVPTGITASQLTVGQPPAGLPGPGGFGPPPGAGQGAGGNGGGNAPADAGFAQATGTVKSLPTAQDAHLGLSLGSDETLYIKVASGAKIMKFTPVSLSDVKVGDRIIANQQTATDGSPVSTVIGVNLPRPNFMGGPGFGGPGGRFGGRPPGGGRFGGPGGFGGPPPGQ